MLFDFYHYYFDLFKLASNTSSLPVFLTRYFGSVISKWIDGYTGDCLGATQQVCEIIFYLSIIVLWKFI
jgi:adenosylcobinamide-GDP ribazoletransferase